MANNKIQIKRSATNSTVPALSNGELAFTGNGNILYIGHPDGSTGNIRIGGREFPGILTANAGLVANATSGIDKIIVANAAISQLNANGSTGSSGQILKSGGAGANSYWDTAASVVSGSNTQIQFNDSGALAGDAGLTYDKTTDTFSTNNVFATATVNATTLSVGSSFVANSSRLVIGTTVGVQANGGIGSQGQVLTSNGTTVFWAAPSTADVTGVDAGAGLTGGGTSGDLSLAVGQGNGISVSADAVAVLANSGLIANATGLHILTTGDSTLIANATGLYVNDASLSIATSQLTGDVALGSNTSGNYVATITAGAGISGSSSSEGGTPTIAVVANNGIVANTTGVFAKQANGITVDAGGINVLAGTNGGLVSNSTGLFILAGDGLITNATGLHMPAGNGISVSADAHAVNGGSTLTVNTSGVHVNSSLSITDLSLSGNLTVLGTLSTIDTTNLTVKDSIIELANGNSASDLLDIGLYGQYGATGTKFTGLFRDASDGGVYKLFSGLTVEPTTTVDTANLSFTQATLQSYLNSGGLVSNSTTVTLTANATVSVNLTANTLSLSTALPATSGGTGYNTYTSGDILIANSSNALTKLGIGADGYVLQVSGTTVSWNTLDGGTF